MADDVGQSEQARRNAFQAAQTLEKKGLVDGAVQAYLAAGMPEESARLLFGARKYAQAGKVLLDAVEVGPARAAELDAHQRKAALQAAICYARAGENALAVEWFVALGERERAAELLRRAGDPVAAARVAQGGRQGTPATGPLPVATGARGLSPAVAQQLESQGKYELAMEAYVGLRQPGHAGRMCVRLGRHAQAAELFVEAGQPYEAATAWTEAGEPSRTLEALERVPREDPRYRQAAVQAIRIASELNALEFQLEHFLTRFVQEPVQNERELEALFVLGKLYQRNDFIENARDAYTKVLRQNPNHCEARAKLEQIESETRGSAMIYERILREEAAFNGGGPSGAPLPGLPTMPGFPDLPGLPGLPAPPSSPVNAWASGRAAGPPGTNPPAYAPMAVAMDAEAGTMASMPSGLRTAPPTPSRPVGPPPTYPPAAAVPGPRPTAPRPPTVPPQPVPAPAPTFAPQPAPVPAATVAPQGSYTAAPPKLVLEPGSVLAERYRLLKKIGQGGMATVFKADDLELGEQVAIKVFTKLVEDEQMVARFKQELTLSRQLNHPNIIRLYDIGTVLGFRYITMELLTGGDLKERLGKPLELKEGIGLLLQSCAALQAAHDKGIIHRDIKPANIFLTNDGTVKLMDFGIAKRQATPGLTVAGMIAGTPEYMSPEQISGFDKVSASTDLYALGIMAYEFFTGAVPFRHPEIMPMLVMQMQDLPPPPRAKNPKIPPELEKIILKLLEKDAANRYASCRELAVALEAVHRRLP